RGGEAISEGEHDLLAGEIEGVLRPLRDVADTCVRLTLVLDERERKLRVRLECLVWIRLEGGCRWRGGLAGPGGHGEGGGQADERRDLGFRDQFSQTSPTVHGAGVRVDRRRRSILGANRRTVRKADASETPGGADLEHRKGRRLYREIYAARRGGARAAPP